jgi:lipoprotein-anchoring transpeptidase ErfK/SrfK
MIRTFFVLVLAVAGFGAAAPAAGVALPIIADGVQVDAIDVGGLIGAHAEARIERTVARPIRLFKGDETWPVSPRRLGATASIDEAVRRALDAGPRANVELRVDVRKQAVRRYVAGLDKRFARPAKNSELVGLVNLRPSFTEPKPGRKVDRAAMVRLLTKAVRSTYRGGQIRLKTLPVPPEVTPDDFGAIVVIKRSSNRLDLYDGPGLVRTFQVATGETKYPTPLGDFEIIIKERDPTWNPPDSDWAKDAEPIPPGPGNPLGTRWMGISSPAVGIHGTPDAASLGYSVSHGCIRMAIPEAEWLFERVDVGTPVYIVPA